MFRGLQPSYHSRLNLIRSLEQASKTGRQAGLAMASCCRRWYSLLVANSCFTCDHLNTKFDRCYLYAIYNVYLLYSFTNSKSRRQPAATGKNFQTAAAAAASFKAGRTTRSCLLLLLPKRARHQHLRLKLWNGLALLSELARIYAQVSP